MTYSYENLGVKVNIHFFTNGKSIPNTDNARTAVDLLSIATKQMLQYYPDCDFEDKQNEDIDEKEGEGPRLCVDGMVAKGTTYDECDGTKDPCCTKPCCYKNGGPCRHTTNETFWKD